MRAARAMLIGVMFVASAQALASEGNDGDWVLMGRVLSLVQSVVHVAAQSNDPRAVERQIDGLLSGGNTEANRLASDLMTNAFEDMPPQYRGTVLALASDFATIARRERARNGSGSLPGPDAALRARKDLTAMGLRYYDHGQFLDAVKRDDALAVELFVAARGLDVGARDADGLTALELARRRNNHRIVELLAEAGR